MAASSSTAVHSSNNQWYHVFINHRGPDVKNTFARSLYLRLLGNGLTPFLDREELEQGEDPFSQIEKAISTASIHVAIFSPGYAKSRWCLDELLLMLESKAPIIPVFYRVTPAEVRWTQITCGEKKTYDGKPRYDSMAIENWRKALSRVADMTGFELELGNGYELEMELLDKLVERILSLLGYSEKIGLDEKVEDFERTIFSEHRLRAKPQVVGIVGLGGVGKTTLAKEFFDRKMSRNMKSCFLSNVRENAAKGILTSLQSQLLKMLTGSDVLIDSINKGIEELRKHLSSCSVLAVLDDVDHLDQIDALLPDRTDLLPNSLIVITSRDKEVIRSSGVENSSIYQLTGLNKQHSLELFCAYAFTQRYARERFESMVDKFLEFCIGLPLFLKVFGALLSDKYDQSEWQEVLNRLQKEFPSEIEKSLQISYDSLNTEQREMFLDCACFFRGLKRDTAIRIWDGSRWEGRLGFQTLQNRCLLEVDIENNIHMHDHLRDFGRALGVTMLPLRLWHCTNINAMLERFPVPTVRGINMVLRDDVDTCGGIDMSTLQLLDTENAILERISRRPMQFPSLIWLRWNKCPDSSLASCILAENLRVLQVSGSELRTLWSDESQAPLQLREIEINAPLSNIPKSIGRLKHLERIVVGSFLSGRVNLTELPQEFCDLQSLKALVLAECSKVKLLPDSFGNLRNLQHVDLSFCRNLERLPDSFGNLRNLQHINLSECHDLERLPDSIGGLRRIRHIDLRGCHSLKRLPNSFGYLSGLLYINLSGCHDLGELPDSFGNLRYLQHIDLQGCHNLEKLPDSFGNLFNLQHINLSNCYELQSLTDSFCNLTNLEHIDLSGCHNLERLPDFFRNLIKLKYLDAEGCSNLTIGKHELSARLEVAQQKCLEQLNLSDEEHQKTETNQGILGQHKIVKTKTNRVILRQHKIVPQSTELVPIANSFRVGLRVVLGPTSASVIPPSVSFRPPFFSLPAAVPLPSAGACPSGIRHAMDGWIRHLRNEDTRATDPKKPWL